MELVYRRKSDIKGNLSLFREIHTCLLPGVFSIPHSDSHLLLLQYHNAHGFIIIGFKSIFGAILLWMARCHIIVVSTAILRTVPFDVGQAVTLEAMKDCLFLGVRIWTEVWSGGRWYWLSRLCCEDRWSGLNFIGVIKMSTKFVLSDGVEVVIDLLSEGVFPFL